MSENSDPYNVSYSDLSDLFPRFYNMLNLIEELTKEKNAIRAQIYHIQNEKKGVIEYRYEEIEEQ